MLAMVFAVMLQQAATGQVVWDAPPPPAAPVGIAVIETGGRSA